MNDPRRAATKRPRGSVATEPNEPRPPLSGYGESDDKAVRVTIGEDGLVEVVAIDPRAMRRGSEALAELARAAMHQAQEDWFRRLTRAKADREEQMRTARERLQEKLDEIDAVHARRMQDLHRLLDGLSQRR